MTDSATILDVEIAPPWGRIHGNEATKQPEIVRANNGSSVSDSIEVILLDFIDGQ